MKIGFLSFLKCSCFSFSKTYVQLAKWSQVYRKVLPCPPTPTYRQESKTFYWQNDIFRKWHFAFSNVFLCHFCRWIRFIHYSGWLDCLFWNTIQVKSSQWIQFFAFQLKLLRALDCDHNVFKIFYNYFKFKIGLNFVIICSTCKLKGIRNIFSLLGQRELLTGLSSNANHLVSCGIKPSREREIWQRSCDFHQRKSLYCLLNISPSSFFIPSVMAFLYNTSDMERATPLSLTMTSCIRRDIRVSLKYAFSSIASFYFDTMSLLARN